MTKIEKYNEAKEKRERLEGTAKIAKQQVKDGVKPFEVSINPLTPILTAKGEVLARELATALEGVIKASLIVLLSDVETTAAIDVDSARLAAKAEAEEILKQVKA